MCKEWVSRLIKYHLSKTTFMVKFYSSSNYLNRLEHQLTPGLSHVLQLWYSMDCCHCTCLLPQSPSNWLVKHWTNWFLFWKLFFVFPSLPGEYAKLRQIDKFWNQFMFMESLLVLCRRLLIRYPCWNIVLEWYYCSVYAFIGKEVLQNLIFLPLLFSWIIPLLLKDVYKHYQSRDIYFDCSMLVISFFCIGLQYFFKI